MDNRVTLKMSEKLRGVAMDAAIVECEDRR